jgi:hypothetical protein
MQWEKLYCDTTLGNLIHIVPYYLGCVWMMVYKIHLYYVCHIIYNKNENTYEINAFSKYFSIIGSGKFFGQFQEY